METENRLKIMKCALQLFAAHGYDGVGIQRIVGAAAVTKPTLYHYFGSKQGLLTALMTHYYEQLDQDVEQAAGAIDDIPVVLEAITKAYFRFANQQPVFYRMQLAMWFAPRDSEPFRIISALKQHQQELLRKVFRRASPQNPSSPERHRLYVATFLGMIHTYIGMALNGYIELDDIAVHRAVHQFLHGIVVE